MSNPILLGILVSVLLIGCSDKDKDLGILSPEPDDMFEIGSEMTILWEIDTFKSNELKIELFQDNMVILEISQSTPNSGSFMWSIPEDVPWGNFFKIKISDNSLNAVEIFSEGHLVLYKIVIFPSPELALQIKKTLHHTQEEITTYDLSYLEIFECELINNLTGIEYCTNLLVFGAKVSSFADIGPLSQLKNLLNLRLSWVEIEDVSPLAELTKLTFLSLYRCGIVETQFLSNMNDLIGLELSNTTITDMRPISNLNQLKYLNLQSNQIDELDWVTTLVNLQKLDLSFNTIQNIDALAQLININVLNLHDNFVQDLQPLVDNTGIGSGDTLHIGGTNLIQWNSPAVLELQNRGVIINWGP